MDARSKPATRLGGRELTLAYDDRIISESLSVDIPDGRFTVIVGANACGKSTLLRGLARLLKPKAGTVILDGDDIHRQPTKVVATKLGILPQQPIAPEGITVSDLVSRGRHPHQRFFRQWSADDETAVDAALAATGTSELAARAVDELSGGQRQRVWIALALAQDTPLMLLDEPTTFLDLAHQVEVLDLLDDLNQTDARTIVAVLHDLNLACRYAHHLIAMKDGAVVATGSPAEVITRELVDDVFDLDAEIMPDPLTGTPLVVPVPARSRPGVPSGPTSSARVPTPTGTSENSPPSHSTSDPSRKATPMRPKRILALLLALFVLAAAACGDDDGGAENSTADNAGTESDSSDEAVDDGSEASGDPVEIDHIFGTTTVDEAPERIVSLGTQWTDVLLAMGTPPVGYVDDTIGADRGLFAWQVDLMPEESTSFAASDGIPFEKVAALEPDLIVGTHYIGAPADYDRLSEIAPTIPLLNSADLVDPWQDLTEVAGRVLRDEDIAEQIVADHEEMVTEAAAEFPNLEGKTYSFANYLSDAIWVVANPTDGASQFFGELGLEIPRELLDLAGEAGRAQISHEQARLLDADLVMMLTNDLDPNDLPGFDQLPAVQNGAFVETSFDEAIALNTPSPISLRHVLDVIRPALEAANDG